MRAVIAIATLLISEATIGEAGDLAYYSFDLGDATDGGPHGLDGAVEGATGTAHDCFGLALAMDGNDYVTVPDDDVLTFGDGDFTIAAWVRLAAFGADGGYYVVAHSTGPGTTNKWILWMGTSGMSFITRSGWTAVGSHGFELDRWYHILVRKTGTRMEAYVDGALIGSSDSIRANIEDPSGPLTIGTAEFDRPNRYMRGDIDEVRLFDHYLGLDEIVALTECPIVGTPTIPQEPILHTWQSLATEAAVVGGLIDGDRVRIYDVTGRLVRAMTATGSTVRWDLRMTGRKQAPSGVYFIAIESSSGELVRRVVVRR